ncbi:hypothetical protein V6574_33715 [Streptomyces sp. SM1P]
MIGAHLLLAVEGGRFLSMTDPPEWARPAVAGLRNENTWPVLAGPADREDVVLSSPIILEDHPALADESPGPLYDATEIDEILSLRTAALTDHEKREARGTDARAAEVIDLVDTMPEAVRERLHGAIRGLREVTGEEDGTAGPGGPGVRPPRPLRPPPDRPSPRAPGTPGGTRSRTPKPPTPPPPSPSTARRSAREAASSSPPASGVRTPRTRSCGAAGPPSKPWSRTWTGRCTSRSSSTTTRATTSAASRAGSSTSSPTR